MDNANLQAAKNDVIRELFVKTADQTYVVARWCFLNRLYLDFYWNGLHAVEKYLKASLLFNERSAISSTPSGKEYGHNIDRLFAEVRHYAGDLLPKPLKKPRDLTIAYWQAETTSKFVKRLNDFGDPANRYNLYGFSQRPEDLYKLDMVVFAIRRVCVNLEANYFGSARQGVAPPFKSNATILKENPRYQFNRLNSRLAHLSGSKATTSVRAAALTHNVPFAPSDYEHGELPAVSSASNPVLYRHIIMHADGGRPNATERGQIIHLANWVLQNIRLSHGAREQVEEARNRLAVQPPNAE